MCSATLLLATLLAPLATVDILRAQEAAADDPAAQRAEAAYQFALGKMQVEEGDYVTALRTYETALALDDDDPYARVELARFHLYLAQISRDTDRRFDHLRQAADHAARALQLAPDNADVLRAQAQIHLQLVERQTSSLATAEQAFGRLRSLVPGDLQVLLSLGQIYLWKQEFSRAQDVLDEAAAYHPGHRMMQTMRLDATLGARDYDAADGVLEAILETDPGDFDNRLRLADLRAGRGDAAGAVAVLRAAPGDQASRDALRQRLADQLHALGENTEALALLDALPASVADTGNLRWLRARVLTGLLEDDDAIEILRPLVVGRPDNAAVDAGAVDRALWLARLYERVGRFDEARGALAPLVERADTPATRARLDLALSGIDERAGDADAAVARLQDAIAAQADSQRLPALVRKLADILQRDDRVDEAARWLDESASRLAAAGATGEALSLQVRRLDLLARSARWDALEAGLDSLPSDAGPELATVERLLRARVHAKRDGTIGMATASALLRPTAEDRAADRVEALVAARVQLLYERGDSDEAAAVLAPYLAEDASEAARYFAIQLMQQGERYVEVIPHVERLAADLAPAVQPVDVEAAAAADDEVPAAADDAPDALAAGVERPSYDDVRFLLAAAYERAGRFDDAVRTFRALLDDRPRYHAAANYLGYMWADANVELDAALALLRRAVMLNPDSGAYLDSLGWVHYRRGDYVEARRYLEWAAALVPGDPTVQEHLGDLYVAIGQARLAAERYRLALDREPDDADALRRKLDALGSASTASHANALPGQGL
ncbi:MAG: tetratricopeptide repeat protein [Acidobacteriota bacterium]